MGIRCHWWDFREHVEFRFPVISCHQTSSPVTQRFRIDAAVLRLQDTRSNAFVQRLPAALVSLTLSHPISIFVSFSPSLSLFIPIFVSLSPTPTQCPLLSSPFWQQQPLSFRILGNDPVTPFYTYKHDTRLFSVCPRYNLPDPVFRTKLQPGEPFTLKSIQRLFHPNTGMFFVFLDERLTLVSRKFAWCLFNTKNRQCWMCTFLRHIVTSNYIGRQEFWLAPTPNSARATFLYAKIYVTHFGVVLVLKFVYK